MSVLCFGISCTSARATNYRGEVCMFSIISIKRFLKKNIPSRWLNIFRYGPSIISRRDYNQIFKDVYRCLAPKNMLDNQDQYWSAVLRQMAHVLDKGCTCETFEAGHSVSYFTLATEALQKIVSEKALLDPSVLWSSKKIDDYEKMQQGKVASQLPATSDLQFDSAMVMDLITSRRSSRTFLEKPVSSETLAYVLGSAVWAPSSCNRQTTKVFATTNLKLVSQCMQQCIGATCFSKYVPFFLCFCVDIRAYSIPSEFFTPYIDVTLGAQNCNLVAHSLGIDVTMLTWASHTDTCDNKLRSILKIPDYYLIVANAVGGYPKFIAETPARKYLDSCFYIRE